MAQPKKKKLNGHCPFLCIRGAENCAIVRDRRQRGRNGVERVKSLGSMKLTELGMVARVGPTVRELAKGEIESE